MFRHYLVSACCGMLVAAGCVSAATAAEISGTVDVSIPGVNVGVSVGDGGYAYPAAVPAVPLSPAIPHPVMVSPPHHGIHAEHYSPFHPRPVVSGPARRPGHGHPAMRPGHPGMGPGGPAMRGGMGGPRMRGPAMGRPQMRQPMMHGPRPGGPVMRSGMRGPRMHGPAMGRPQMRQPMMHGPRGGGFRR